MKKIYIALAVLSTAMLLSCQQEQSFNDIKVGEFDVAFSIANGATRSGESAPAVRQGAVIPMESEVSGQSYVLEETIVDLDVIGAAPVTRGTPAYTENLGVLYANELMVQGSKGLFQTETNYSNLGNEMSQGGWRYQGTYTGDPWPASENDTVDFYFRMPSKQTNVTGITRAGGKFTFNYTSPASAKEQQDILFAYRPLTKAQHKAYLSQGGTPILFNHALTGVKFAIGNESDELANVKIKSITITGLVSEGSCVLTPAKENEYRDEKDTTFSSKTAAVWTLKSTKGTFTSEEFGDPVAFTNGGSFENNGKYGNSFAPTTINNPKANTQNLNDTDATQTFWVIPQQITNDVKLIIEYSEDGGKTYPTWEVNFGEALHGVKWEAGQLRTYTIKVDFVNVMIEDTVNIVKKESESEDEFVSYEGSTKTGMIITNTGNTDVYVRAAIIGQWLDEDGNPVFGFTDRTAGEVVEVASWYEDQFGTNPTYTHGEFTGLAGYKNFSSDYWVKGSDGYYYYKYVVPANKGTIPGAYKTISGGVATDVAGPTSDEDKDAQRLFASYIIKEAPDARVADQRKAIIFTLEVATQAISAKKTDGSYYENYTQAWNHAKDPDNN